MSHEFLLQRVNDALSQYLLCYIPPNILITKSETGCMPFYLVNPLEWGSSCFFLGWATYKIIIKQFLGHWCQKYHLAISTLAFPTAHFLLTSHSCSWMAHMIPNKGTSFLCDVHSINKYWIGTVNFGHPAHLRRTNTPAVGDSDPYSITHLELSLVVLQFGGGYWINTLIQTL